MRHRTIGGLAATMILVAACGGGSADDEIGAGDGADTEVTVDDDQSDDRADDGDPADADAADTDAADGDEGDQTLDVDASVDGPPWGPDDPIVPGRYGAVHPAGGGGIDCDLAGSEGQGEFWQYVAAACRAALGTGDWPGGPIPAPEATDNPFTACLDADVVAWLQRLEQHFAQHPGQPPELVEPAELPVGGCRTKVYVFGVEAVDGGIEVGLAMENPPPFEFVPPEFRLDGELLSPDVGNGDDEFTPQLIGGPYLIAGPFSGPTLEIEGTNVLGTSTVTIELPPEVLDPAQNQGVDATDDDPDDGTATTDPDSDEGDGGGDADGGSGDAEGDDGG